MEIERCIECDEPTGKAGQCEDSLYVGDSGPYCEECFEWKAMIADSNEEKDVLRRRIAELEDQLADANAARQDMYGSTYCVACGAKFEEDKPDTKGRVIAHVMTCAKHPMRAVEAQRDGLARRVRLAVNEWCSCGGRGPDDEAACSACHVLHMVFGEEVT
jgi:hypothetical protein